MGTLGIYWVNSTNVQEGATMVRRLAHTIALALASSALAGAQPSIREDGTGWSTPAPTLPTLLVEVGLSCSARVWGRQA